MRTILSVWAHPDDETYLAGGLMARAIETGSRVVCVTATRGEQGSSDPTRWPPGDPLAAVRTDELAAALAELGVREHIWLDYPDGGCAGVEDREAVDRLRRIVDEVGPDTVLTFGPDGMTGHRDHCAVSRWATAAVRDSGVAVHYATQSPAWMAEFGPTLTELGAYYDGAEPPVTDEAEMSLLLRLDGAELDRKMRAMRHQDSQVSPLIDATSEDFFRRAIAEEAFRRA